MELFAFDPDDTRRMAGYLEVLNAARAVDSPWVHPTTVRAEQGLLRYGWDGEPQDPYLAVAEDVPVATGVISTSEWDNIQLAWLYLHVHPAHRRQGYGSAMLAALIEEARRRGRTSIVIEGWEGPAPRGFGERHGLEVKSVAVQRRQHLAEVDWSGLERLHTQARGAAADYEILRQEGLTPAHELEAVAALSGAINDAPTDDLEIEDEVYNGDRVGAYERAQLDRGRRLYRTIARHRESGELAGHTVVAVDAEQPRFGEQHDTAVSKAHRGHRLGLLLKTEMNLWLRQAEPQLTEIDTWNAASNDFMIGVNEAIGYRPMGRELAFQMSI